MSFSERELRDILQKKAETKISSSEMVVNAEETSLEYEISAADVDKGTASASAKMNVKVGKKIDQNEVKKVLKNSKLGNARSKITQIDGVDSADISVKPSFLPILPLLSSRIKVNFDYQK